MQAPEHQCCMESAASDNMWSGVCKCQLVTRVHPRACMACGILAGIPPESGSTASSHRVASRASVFWTQRWSLASGIEADNGEAQSDRVNRRYCRPRRLREGCVATRQLYRWHCVAYVLWRCNRPACGEKVFAQQRRRPRLFNVGHTASSIPRACSHGYLGHSAGPRLQWDRIRAAEECWLFKTPAVNCVKRKAEALMGIRIQQSAVSYKRVNWERVPAARLQVVME